MLSICIPIYNFDVRLLTESLAKQIEMADFPCELVLIDDGSSTEFKEINNAICSRFRYILLKDNVGRSKIRNLFLNYAKYDHLLFLDCDSIVENPDFVTNYLNVLQDAAVICGGRVYPKSYPNRSHLLRWKYGTFRECQSADVRQVNPNKSFMTNNFLIQRSLFDKLSFDESLAGYGHEDTLFGYLLKQNGVRIHHIENPVMNGDIESNRVFIEKTECGLKNLANIAKRLDFNSDFITDVTLISFYVSIKKNRFLCCLDLSFFLFCKLVRTLLIGGVAWLWLFNYYKLGMFSVCVRKMD